MNSMKDDQEQYDKNDSKPNSVVHKNFVNNVGQDESMIVIDNGSFKMRCGISEGGGGTQFLSFQSVVSKVKVKHGQSDLNTIDTNLKKRKHIVLGAPEFESEPEPLQRTIVGDMFENHMKLFEINKAQVREFHVFCVFACCLFPCFFTVIWFSFFPIARATSGKT